MTKRGKPVQKATSKKSDVDYKRFGQGVSEIGVASIRSDYGDISLDDAPKHREVG
jgi:hypothetical protein